MSKPWPGAKANMMMRRYPDSIPNRIDVGSMSAMIWKRHWPHLECYLSTAWIFVFVCSLQKEAYISIQDRKVQGVH